MQKKEENKKQVHMISLEDTVPKDHLVKELYKKHSEAIEQVFADAKGTS